MKDTSQHETLLRNMFSAAVEAASPSKYVASYLPAEPRGKTVVIGAGKATAAMAKAVEAHWSKPLSGLIIVPHGPHPACEHIDVVQARHPVPDEAGVTASRRMLELVSELGENDLVISLISGGGSALLSLPGAGISMEDKQHVHTELLKCGAAIDEMNCVRKHLSAVKGGRLAAAAYPAKVVTLAISDVPGDNPSTIASGPTVLNTSTREQAISIIGRYNIALPDRVQQLLNSCDADTPTGHDKRMASLQTHIICKPQQSLMAAANVASRAGVTPLILGDAIEGEAREVGKVMAGIAKQVQQYDQPATKPAVLISGGETTVTVRKKGGRGGRNAEFLLGFAAACNLDDEFYALSADTDGIDGTEDNAGVLWTPRIALQAKQNALSCEHYLDNNDAWSFFNALDALITTGPTHTNVNDFRAIIING